MAKKKTAKRTGPKKKPAKRARAREFDPIALAQSILYQATGTEPPSRTLKTATGAKPGGRAGG